MVIDMVCMIKTVLTNSSSQNLNLQVNQLEIAQSSLMLGSVQFESTPSRHHPRQDSNSSDITLLYGVLHQLGPFNSRSYF